MSEDREGTREISAGDAIALLLTDHGLKTEVIDKIKIDLGATTVEDLSALTEADLVGIGMKPLQARALLKKLVPEPEPAPRMDPMSSVAILDVLPTLPDDASWLQALKVGGILKFNRETVIGTVSAALASRVGLYDLPERIKTAMEENAASLEEPVGADFFEMQRMLTEHNYAEIFAALPGVTGSFATKARKKSLLDKMDEHLWGSLIGFQERLGGWMDAWQKTMGNPAAMMGAMAALVSGGGALPAGMMAPPPTDPLRDAAEGVVGSINRVFAGTGIPVAMALAYDAQQIRKALENPNLPAQVGALNRDQMLKKLGVAVESDYPRLETSLKRYALGVIELPNVSPGQTELTFITALYQLGSSIPWSKLGVGSRGDNSLTGIGGYRRDGRL